MVRKRVANAHKNVYKALNTTREPENKLIDTVQHKNKYVCNISTLIMALNHGLELPKVYRAIKFNQSAWLRRYIDMNTERAQIMILRRTSLNLRITQFLAK